MRRKFRQLHRNLNAALIYLRRARMKIFICPYQESFSSTKEIRFLLRFTKRHVITFITTISLATFSEVFLAPFCTPSTPSENDKFLLSICQTFHIRSFYWPTNVKVPPSLEPMNREPRFLSVSVLCSLTPWLAQAARKTRAPPCRSFTSAPFHPVQYLPDSLFIRKCGRPPSGHCCSKGHSKHASSTTHATLATSTTSITEANYRSRVLIWRVVHRRFQRSPLASCSIYFRVSVTILRREKGINYM